MNRIFANTLTHAERRLVLLRVLLALGIAITATFLVFVLLTDVFKPIATYILATLLILQIILRARLNAKTERAVGIIMLGSIWVAILLASLTNQGILNPTVIHFIHVVLVTGLVYGRQTAATVMVITIAAEFGIFVGVNGLTREATEAWILHSSTLLVASIVAYLGDLMYRSINRRLLEEVKVRKQSEAALAASEERFRSLLENAPVAFILRESENLTDKYMNPAAYELFGIDPAVDGSEVDLMDMVGPEYRLHAQSRREAAWSGKEVPPLDFTVTRPDGREIVIEVSSKQIDYQGGTALLTTAVDVTARKLAENALKESEDRFRTALEASPIAFVINSTSGSQTFYANPAAVLLFGGTSMDDLIGFNFRDFVLPEDQNLLRRNSEAAARRENISATQYHLRTLDNREIVAEVASVPISQFGEPAYLTTIVDITARRAAEEALRESEYRYQQLTVSSPVASIVFSAETERILYINPRGVMLLGAASAEDLIGEPVQDYMKLDFQDNPSINPAVSTSSETKLTRLDNQIVYVDTRFINTTYQGQDAVHAVLVDVTERKRAESALARSEQLRQGLIEASPLPMTVISLETRSILFMNSASLQLFGASSLSEVIGRSAGLFVSPEYDNQLAERLIRLAKGEPLERITSRMVRFDGITFDAELNTIPTVYNGKLAALSIVRDVTEDIRLTEIHHAVLDRLPIGVRVSSLTSLKVLYANPAYLQMMEASSIAEINLNREGDFSTTPEYNAIARERIERLRNSEQLPPIEYQYKTLKGNIIDVEVKPLVTTFQGEKAAITFITDNTARKRAESVLKDSEDRYQKLMDTSPAAIAVGELENYEILYINQAGAEFFGVGSPENMIGRSINEFIIEDFRSLSNQRRASLNASGALPPVEYQYLRPDGSIVEAEVASVMISYQGKNAAMSVFRDVTERNKAQRELQKSEERYRDLLDSSPMAIAVGGLYDSIISYVNRKAQELFGAESPNDLIGIKSSDLIDYINEREFKRNRKKLESGEATTPTHFVVKRLSGERVNVEIMSMPLLYEGKESILSTLVDITERKQMEEEKRRAESLFAELERERSISELKQSFISTMSHEFRTPLTIALSSKDLLQRYYDRMPPTRREEHFTHIENAIHFMTDSLEDTTLLSQAEADLLDFDPTPFYLPDLIHAEIARHHQRFRDTHLINLEIVDDWPKVLIDELLFAHALLRILSNAARYSEPETPINVKLCREDDTIIIVVQDEGIGIPKEEQGDLFVPFFRASNTEGISGLGLGLATSKTAIERHGGSVSLSSEVGQGTTVTIRLPYRPH